MIIGGGTPGDGLLVEAARGDACACYDLGVASSCGTLGQRLDLVQAHKWFNLAAIWGDGRGAVCRSEIADEMTARAWLGGSQSRAA